MVGSTRTCVADKLTNRQTLDDGDILPQLGQLITQTTMKVDGYQTSLKDIVEDDHV